MTIPEYKTTTIEKQRFILSHYGLGKSCWDWLILIVSFYVAIVVPYNATFKEKAPTARFGLETMTNDNSNNEQQQQQAAARTPSTPFESIPSGDVLLASSTFNSNSNLSNSPYLATSTPDSMQLELNECVIDSIDIFVEIVFIIGWYFTHYF